MKFITVYEGVLMLIIQPFSIITRKKGKQYGLFLLGIISVLCGQVVAQSSYQSETLIKYDITTHKTDKPIPFDRAFTLVVEKLSSKNIVGIDAYEAIVTNGNRHLVYTTFQNCKTGKMDTTAIHDIQLNYNPYSDTLQIFFPPLKPNIDFDVNVIYRISDTNKALLMKLNEELANNSRSAESTFGQFSNAMTDRLNKRGYLRMNFGEYTTFFESRLRTHYDNISEIDSVTTPLSELYVQAIDAATSQHLSDFAAGDLLLETSKRNLFPEIMTGLSDISEVFLPDDGIKASRFAGSKRLNNIESNITFIDSVLRRVSRVISKGVKTVVISRKSVSLNKLRDAVYAMKSAMVINQSNLVQEMKSITAIIDGEDRIRQGIYLVGSTVFSDLKTSGGNLLFLDAGLTNIVAPGLRNQAVYIPKLYWGVSIYFRPIDKNTRVSRFPKKFYPPQNETCKCKIDSTVSLNGGIRDTVISFGPDYGIVSKWSIWQHLSLNLGITLGGMQHPEFENLYNNTSLLIGPTYRFTRGFKGSIGMALLRRDSKNPLISEKRVVPSAYASLSVDIDFIQGFKDITSMLFK